VVVYTVDNRERDNIRAPTAGNTHHLVAVASYMQGKSWQCVYTYVVNGRYRLYIGYARVLSRICWKYELSSIFSLPPPLGQATLKMKFIPTQFSQFI